MIKPRNTSELQEANLGGDSLISHRACGSPWFPEVSGTQRARVALVRPTCSPSLLVACRGLSALVHLRTWAVFEGEPPCTAVDGFER